MSDPADRPTRHILILSDGRPGHYNLSKGIAAAIARRTPHTITWQEVRRGKWPGQLTALMINGGLAPKRVFRWVYRLNIDNIPPADIIISAGAETLAANVALARARGVLNIFFGSLRAFRPADFALVLTSYKAATNAPNVIMTLKPSARDVDTRPQAQGEETRLALLVGGDTSGITYDDHDWDDLFAVLEKPSVGLAWSISNSRRTPDAVSDRLAQLARDNPSRVEQFIDVRTSGAGTLDELFDKAGTIVCTADSSSMLSEAVWARRPVIAIKPRTFALTANEAEYRRWLCENGWMAEADLNGLSADAIQSAAETLQTLAGNPLDDLADLIAEHIPGLSPVSRPR